MQRQKTIFSFFQKPAPVNPSSGSQLVSQVPVTESALEIKGTDTPPEKVPRQIFPASYVANESKTDSSLFSSIMHKFVKPTEREKLSKRNNSHGNSVDNSIVSEQSIKPKQLSEPGLASQPSGEIGVVKSNGKANQSCTVNIESDDNNLGPETPGTQRFVPRLKRIQDDVPASKDKHDRLLSSSKKLKLLEESTGLNRNRLEISETASKFEWLDPSRIKDANGRKRDDPLYDSTTLYIPADALKKMSASQKQYWNVKCQYMDVMLFFKVGKFYELYEIDAEIGHKELDWKITLSGVGKCRQVGVPESGIDDAVQKLVARGHKVGRIEQLETSGESKARGSTSVISRKLVQVFSPSTATDCNIGPDAVHLLAIKEGKFEQENGSTVYGFAFVDCAALKFWVGSIKDDASFAGLGALLMQVSPKEVLYESRGLSKEVQKALRKYSVTGSSSPQLTPVQPTTDFADAPELDDVLQNGDVLPYQVYRGCLKMDGQTLINLEIFNNNADGGTSGTLYKYLDNCVTSSGKRLLRRWICHPLKDVDRINYRLNVVEALMQHPEIMLVVAQYLRKLPDLERLFGRIRATVKSSATLSVPVYGKKVLKQKNHDVTDRDAEIISILIELFIEKASEWSQIIHAINCIDVLRSFAVTASFSSGTMSRPVILPLTKNVTSNGVARRPVLKIKGLWHPFAFGDNGRVPVPNDVVLGEDANGYGPPTLLLTGPNMGGKSTLLRSTCLAVILAQLGCYVPGEMCVLSLVDTVFTRLGATDRIMTGESTFFIECTETASILHHATQDSLVILDELGRGTSTFDGYAIAYAVFRHLIEKVNCRLLFATHYHPLTKEFASHPHVLVQHMACYFKPKSESFSQNEDLVFLYQLTSGACPESYGLQVATMAGIPQKVVNAASKAGRIMKKSIVGDSFKSSEGRAEFSTLHEEWLKSLMNISLVGSSNSPDEEDDVLTLCFVCVHTS
uniref:DNA mismatch repair proteins mutS family domain-containing protein n=1 Tax=Cannabis sativa TaxID=3483 RepID=A0A803NYY0_CANSA